METRLSEPFPTRRMKILGRPDGFMTYGELAVDFSPFLEFLCPNLKLKLRLIGARHNFYMISHNPNVSPGIFDCSLYSRCIVLREYYHKKRIYMLACIPVEFNYMETLAKTPNFPARRN